MTLRFHGTEDGVSEQVTCDEGRWLPDQTRSFCSLWLRWVLCINCSHNAVSSNAVSGPGEAHQRKAPPDLIFLVRVLVGSVGFLSAELS